MATSQDHPTRSHGSFEPRFLEGYFLGFLGILGFGGTFPATRLAVEGIDPILVACGRAVIAAGLGALVLYLAKAPPVPRHLYGRLLRYGLCVTAGFPVLVTLALQWVTAAHGGVILALMPLTTAMASVPVGGERPSRGFWICGALGSLVVLAYALRESHGFALSLPDLMLFGAMALGSWGYAEGAMLSRVVGGWQAISWALIAVLPFMLGAVLLDFALGAPVPLHASARAWAGFAYVTLISQFAAFFAWNQGLALGGIAKVGQVQLLQAFVTLAIAALINGEKVGANEILFALAVVVLVAAGARMRVAHTATRR